MRAKVGNSTGPRRARRWKEDRCVRSNPLAGWWWWRTRSFRACLAHTNLPKLMPGRHTGGVACLDRRTHLAMTCHLTARCLPSAHLGRNSRRCRRPRAAGPAFLPHRALRMDIFGDAFDPEQVNVVSIDAASRVATEASAAPGNQLVLVVGHTSHPFARHLVTKGLGRGYRMRVGIFVELELSGCGNAASLPPAPPCPSFRMRHLWS